MAAVVIGLATSANAEPPPICADRPAKANAVCTVPVGKFQLETGAIGWSLTKRAGMRIELLAAAAVVAPTEAVAQADGSFAITAATSALSDEPVDATGQTLSESQPVVLTTPGMAGPLAANPHPTTIDSGFLGKIYITGAISGLGIRQGHVLPGDDRTPLDLSNGQIFVQSTEGPIQFFVQAGAYSLPSLGTAYVKAEDAGNLTYGVVPVAFIRIVPDEHFNIMIGKLPTLQGAESTFTFQNMNVNRGLLWNQENAINRGVQANYSKGPFSLSLSLNDGFYSGKYNWLSGIATYTAGLGDTISVVAADNIGRTNRSTFATPLLQNNGQVYDLIWTHTVGSWTVQPYLQYTHVPADAALGITKGASTYGAAVLAKYALTPEFNLAGRAEYMNSTGSVANGAPSLLYGPGSNAWSLTLTPTYQRRTFFVRGELGYVRANGITVGSGLGPNLSNQSQTRATVELGILF